VAIYTGVISLVIAATMPALFSIAVPNLASDGHAITSLNVAVSRTFCGAPSATSSDDSGKPLFRAPADSDRPVRQIIDARWGSLARYCSTLTHPFMNNENSLMLLESWTWRVAPNLSLLGIGRVLLALKIALLVFFCAVFLRVGAGVVLSFAIVDAAAALVGKLQPLYAYSAYSFLLCLVLATIAIYPLMLTLSERSRMRTLVWPAVAGIWSAFVVNMRTSYLPICVACALIYVCAVLVEPRDAFTRARHRLRHVAVAGLLFLAGYASFQYVLIAKSRPEGTNNLSYHTLFHPLVLSIGLPVNEFSQREGIEWDDGVGLTLAHRVNPSAIYLTKDYEEALRTYYFSLWKRYPAEMSRVYLEKAELAGTEMMELRDVPNPAVSFARRLLSAAPNGLWLLSLLVGFTVVPGWMLFHRRNRPLLLPMTLMGTAGTMLMIESMLIVPRYYLTYHSPLLLLYCALVFVLIQFAFNALVRVLAPAAAGQLRMPNPAG
jgi:hypothetical protein